MIDVIIPTIESDIPTLRKCVPCLKENLKDGVSEIYVVSPKSHRIMDICDEFCCNFIYEEDLIGFGPYDFEKLPYNRNGWLYQQLIKLSGYKLSNTDDFLIIDSDHLLLKPHEFKTNNKYVFYYTDEYHEPYFRTLDKLLNNKYKKVINKSFISDKMIFNKNIVKELKNEIENVCKIDWLKAIIKNYDKTTISGFSEFETYGTYLSKNYPHRYILEPAIRKHEKNKEIFNLSIEEIKEKYSNYNSLTFYKE